MRCLLANSVLGWSNKDIWDYLLNSMDNIIIKKDGCKNDYYIKIIFDKIYYWGFYNGCVKFLRYHRKGGVAELTIYSNNKETILVNNIKELYKIDLLN